MPFVEALKILRHSNISSWIASQVLIAAPVSFGFVYESRGLEISGLDSERESLVEVIGGSPAWWRPTARAKAIARLVPNFRFAHGLGLIQARLTTNRSVFLLSHGIQITDF
jgi:hypothetical protein